MLPEYRSARLRLKDCPRRGPRPHCPLPIGGRSAHSPTERRIAYEVISAAPLAQAEPQLI
jgi:hypothetical protein